MSAIHAILFDLGNVLLRVDELRFIRRLAARSRQPWKVVGGAFQHSALVAEFGMGRLAPEAFYRELSREVGFAGDYAEFVKIWSEIFSPIEPTLALAQELKGKLPRVILSNTNVLHMDYIDREFPGIRDFDGHVLSYEVGLQKPDVRIYELALRRHGLEAARTLFIDDLAENCEGARAAGLQAIQCVGPKQLRAELTKLGVLTI